ncbi:unnamed protein product, partial [marine sediment metagenome]
MHIRPDLGTHYIFTDMTIVQARRAHRFAIAKTSSRQLDEAELIQQEILAEAKHVFTLSDWCRESIVSDCGVPKGKV